MKAQALSGSPFTYTNKTTGAINQAFTLWYIVDGVPYSFKMGCFGDDQIAKAKAAIASGTFQLEIEPDRNCNPIFRIK